jgi:hypothetical protein
MICKVFSFLVRSRKKQRKAGFYDLIGDLFGRLVQKIGQVFAAANRTTVIE